MGISRFFSRADPTGITRQRLILASVSLASLLGALDMSIVNIANPAIIKSFQVSIGMGSLVILSYILTISVLILLMGKLGDRIGFRSLLLYGFVVFGIGSFLCGIAPCIGWLIGARILQAIGAAMFSSIGPAVITEFLPGHERGKSLGYLISLSAVGFALGPGIGGFITMYADWHWIFFINLPIIAIAFLLGYYYIPRQILPAVPTPLGWVGPVTFIIALLCLLLAFSLYQVPGTPDLVLLLLLLTGVLFGILFWQYEKRSKNPLISPALIKSRDFRAGILSCLIITMLFSGITYLMPLYLVNSRHLDQFTAGLIMMVPALFSIFIAPVAGSLADRHGTVLISTIAIGLTAAGFLIFTMFDPWTVVFVIVIGMLLTRVSTAAFFGPNGKLIMNHCREGTVGNGSGVMMTVRHVGLVMGIALFQSIFALRMYAMGVPRDGTPLVPKLTPAMSELGYQAVYITSFILCVIVILILRRTKEVPDLIEDEEVPEAVKFPE
ncbi:MAG: MFS transporter [Methanoregula sp.]|nr:MFS transporter [Methanoregula sp.]